MDTNNLNVVQPDLPESNPSFFTDLLNRFKSMKNGKVVLSVLGLLVAVGGLTAGIVAVKDSALFNQRAFNSGIPTVNVCNKVDVTTTDNSCPNITSPAVNPVSNFSVIYSFKNTSTSPVEVAYTKKTNFCQEQYGQPDATVTGGFTCSSSNLTTTDYLTLAAGETRNVTVDRVSDKVIACGSYKTSLYVDSVDGVTNCQGAGLVTPVTSSLCKTGISCIGTDLSNSYCDSISAYSLDWSNHYSPKELSQLHAGDSIYLCGTGANGKGTFDQIKFLVNGLTVGPTIPAITRPGSPNAFEFCEKYTIPAGTLIFNITAQLHDVITNTWK